METSKLKPVLGLPTTTFIAIGFTIGGGVFVLTGIVLKEAGAALPLCYALAVLPVFISLLPVAMLGSAMPTVGGSYRYPSLMVSKSLAFVGIWVYALASFFGQIPLYAMGCGKYIQVFLPSISEQLIALFLVTFLLVINLLGVKIAAQIQGIFVITLILALIYYVFQGSFAVDMERFEPIFDQGSGKIALGVALLTFTYFGSNGIIELGGEIKRPGKVIPRAFFIALPTVALVYISVSFITIGASSLTELMSAEEPLVHVIRQTSTQSGVIFFVLCGAVLALLTTLNALFLVGTKSLLIMIEDGLFPKALGAINSRFRTPHLLLILIWLLSVAGILSGIDLETLAAYAALGILILFLPIQIAALKFPKLYPEEYQKSEFKLRGFGLWFCTIIGMIMVVFFGAVIMADLGSLWKIGLFFAFLLSGIVMYFIMKKINKNTPK